MASSNNNFVCFNCRTAIRYPKLADRVPHCVRCGGDCFCMGSKVAVPAHEDTKAWHDLELECQRRTLVAAEAVKLRKVQRQHFLEREIQLLQGKPDNRDRNRYIKKLADELTRLLAG